MLDRPSGLGGEHRRGWPAGGDEAAARVPLVVMLSTLAGMLRRRKHAALAVASLVPLAVLLILLQLTPRYTAVATLLYDPSAYAARELESILRSDPTNDAIMASQIEILRSRPMAERLIDRFNLMRVPTFNAALRPPTLLDRLGAALRVLLRGPRHGGDHERSLTILAVQKAIDAKTVKTSRVVEVSFTADDPDLAAAAANAVVEFYIEDQRALKAAAVEQAHQWLDTRAADLRAEVREAETRIAGYRADEGMVTGVQGGLDVEQISRLAADLTQARNDLADAQSRLDSQTRLDRTGGSGAAAIAPNVVALRAQQSQFTAQLQAGLSKFGPGNPAVLALRDQIAELDHSVARETAQVVAATEAEVRSGRAKVAALEQQVEQARLAVNRGARSGVSLNAMQREMDASRKLLEAVLERNQQTAQQAAIETPDARMIAPAWPPDSPSFPRMILFMAAAVVAGCFLAVVAVYLLESGETTFRTSDEIRLQLGLPCFAMVPQIRRRALGRARVEDYVAERPLSPFSEQLRSLRAGLWLGSEQPRVIAITAARPAEGKTTVAIALGRSAAMSGERVIVLDCDVRQPSFGRLMQADGHLGITDHLLGHADLASVVQEDLLTSMKFIPAGSAEMNSLGLFMSDAMGALLAELRQHYDLVLLDAPPAYAMADARVIARTADATLLCVRWHDTPRRVVRNSLDLLEETSARVVGVAITRVNARAHVRSGFSDSDIYSPRYGGYFRE